MHLYHCILLSAFILTVQAICSKMYERCFQNRISDEYLEKVNAGSQITCSIRCLNDPSCIAFSFQEETGNCYLSKSYPSKIRPQDDNTMDFVVVDTQRAFNENIAVGKKTYGHHRAAIAIDGVLQWYGPSCAFGLRQRPYGWIAIDLGHRHHISHGRILGRGDHNLPNNLYDFHITVGDNEVSQGTLLNENALCYKHDGPGVFKGWTNFNCYCVLSGRHVAVFQVPRSDFVICEVEIFGKNATV